MEDIMDKAVKLALEGKANIGSIVVIEPMDYDFREGIIEYPEFEFAISSTDKRIIDDLLITLNGLQDGRIIISQTDFNTLSEKVIDDRLSMEFGSNKQLKIYASYFWALVANTGKQIYLLAFDTTMKDGQLSYIIYCGTEELEIEEIQGKLKEKHDSYEGNPELSNKTKSYIMFFIQSMK